MSYRAVYLLSGFTEFFHRHDQEAVYVASCTKGLVKVYMARRVLIDS